MATVHGWARQARREWIVDRSGREDLVGAAIVLGTVAQDEAADVELTNFGECGEEGLAGGGRVGHCSQRAVWGTDTGLAAGGTDNGAPGIRAHYHPSYYGAFVLDPDGNNIEAVCHAPA